MALSVRKALLLAGIALVITGLPTAAKVVRWFTVISMLFQPVAAAREIMADCQELARCVQMILREVNRIIDFFLNLYAAWYHEEVEKYTLAQIRAATNNFAHLIGQGVSGRVYGGALGDGRMVAVKRLKDCLRRRAEDTFGMELALLQPLSHDHVVRLVGSCADGEHRILVYEHIDNGTLRDHLNNNGAPPTWITRVQVLLGAARAIEYLHGEDVIHSNVTSANILLDRSLTPRVFGFGASVRRPSEAVGVVQTEGYRDPEYDRTRRLKPATDVYSLGVVMLEVLTGQPPVRANNATLVSWALPSIQAGKLDDVLDRRPTSKPTQGQRQALELVAKTAASCLCRDGDNRRAISRVVKELEEALKLICTDDSFGYY
jgi:serine/threonine protein kinase